MLQPAPTAADLRELIAGQTDKTGTSGTTQQHPRLPVHPQLSPAFPGGLRAGAVYSLIGSLSVAIGLAAGASAEGSWSAAAGMPHLGIEAAAAWGVDLERFVVIPRLAGSRWISTIAALSQVCDVIVAAPGPPLSTNERGRLDARLRTQGCTIIVTGPWQRPAATVHATTIGWAGLHQGHGALAHRTIRLDITERHRQRTMQLTVPL